MANFTFDFDLADDLDDDFDLIPAPSQINSETKTEPALSHEAALFSEVSVSELVRQNVSFKLQGFLHTHLHHSSTLYPKVYPTLPYTFPLCQAAHQLLSPVAIYLMRDSK